LESVLETRCAIPSSTADVREQLPEFAGLSHGLCTSAVFPAGWRCSANVAAISEQSVSTAAARDSKSVAAAAANVPATLCDGHALLATSVISASAYCNFPIRSTEQSVLADVEIANIHS
jgi:hypothetical protein